MNITNLTRAASERDSLLPVRVFVDTDGGPETGLSVTMSMSRESDGLLFDWDDDTFKVDPTTPLLTLTGNAFVPGMYDAVVDHSSLVESDRLLFLVFATGVTKAFAVEAFDRTDPVPDLAVDYSIDDEKFAFTASLMTRDGLADEEDAEPYLYVYKDDGTLVFTALPEDFSESNGVFSAEYSGLLIVKGSWVAVLKFEAFGAEYSTQFSFNVG